MEFIRKNAILFDSEGRDDAKGGAIAPQHAFLIAMPPICEAAVFCGVLLTELLSRSFGKGSAKRCVSPFHMRGAKEGQNSGSA